MLHSVPVRFREQPSNVSVTNGHQDLVLNCVAEGLPLPEIWLVIHIISLNCLILHLRSFHIMFHIMFHIIKHRVGSVGVWV